MSPKALVRLALCSSVLLLTSSAHAALNAYLQLKGAKSGVIKGSSTTKGLEDAIIVIDAEQTSLVPVDASSGQATGKERIGHLTITKEVDRSSPILRQALTNSENITEGTLSFLQPSANGLTRSFYTIKLGNARLVSIKTEIYTDPSTKATSLRETVEIAYERADWIWVDGGITATESLSRS